MKTSKLSKRQKPFLDKVQPGKQYPLDQVIEQHAPRVGPVGQRMEQRRQRASYIPIAPTATRSSDSNVRCE